jgi:hypothetical protein
MRLPIDAPGERLAARTCARNAQPQIPARRGCGASPATRLANRCGFAGSFALVPFSARKLGSTAGIHNSPWCRVRQRSRASRRRLRRHLGAKNSQRTRSRGSLKIPSAHHRLGLSSSLDKEQGERLAGGAEHRKPV